MIGYSDATVITAIAAVFFAVIAVLAFGRAMFRRYPPTARRFRVGVFIERDHEQIGEGPEDEQRTEPRD